MGVAQIHWILPNRERKNCQTCRVLKTETISSHFGCILRDPPSVSSLAYEDSKDLIHRRGLPVGKLRDVVKIFVNHNFCYSKSSQNLPKSSCFCWYIKYNMIYIYIEISVFIHIHIRYKYRYKYIYIYIDRYPSSTIKYYIHTYIFIYIYMHVHVTFTILTVKHLRRWWAKLTTTC